MLLLTPQEWAAKYPYLPHQRWQRLFKEKM